MKALTKDQLFSQYPGQWVMLGDPELNEKLGLRSIRDLLLNGVVLFAGKTRKEVAENAKDFRKGHKTYTCIYTGEFPKTNRICSGLTIHLPSH